MFFLYAIGAVALFLLVLDRADERGLVAWWGQLLGAALVAVFATVGEHGTLYAVPAEIWFGVLAVTVQNRLVRSANAYMTPARSRRRAEPL